MISPSIQTVFVPRLSQFPAGDRFQFHVKWRFTSKTKWVSLRRAQSSKSSTPIAEKADFSLIIAPPGPNAPVKRKVSVRIVKTLFFLFSAFVAVSLASLLRGRRPRPVSKTGGGRGRRITAVGQEGSVRRELAIRRVAQGEDDDSNREFFLFVTARGETMFTQSWTPVAEEIRGLVVVMHGLNEHSDRYSAFAKELNATGFKVYAMDWIGHGGSDGLHAYVHSLDEAVLDTKSFITMVLAQNPGLPCFCFGHSTGAAIVLKAVLDPEVEACITGIVLTSPAVAVKATHPIFAAVAPFFSVLFPRLQMSVVTKQGVPVSRDADALLAKYSDPLVYTGSIRIRTGHEILRLATYLQQNLKRIKVPFLVLHGTADTITNPNGSKRLYSEASSTDKTIKLLEGFLHDLLFEPERKMIVQEIIDWLNKRI